MLSAVIYNLRNLLSPKGRDGRGVFWRYFLFVIMLNIVCLAIVVIPVFGVLVAEISPNAGELDTGTLEADILRKMAEIGFAESLARLGLGLGVLNIAMLTAAIVRRCHDANLSGLIVFVPLGLQLVWMYFAVGQVAMINSTVRMAAEARDSGREATIDLAMIAQDLLGWIVVLIVVLIGLAKSVQGPNRHGERPAEG